MKPDAAKDVAAPGRDFWTAIVRLPPVKPSYVAALIRSEASKLYPGAIPPEGRLVWTVLSEDGEPGIQCLVSIPRKTDSAAEGIPAIHVAVRWAIDARMRRAGVKIVIFAGDRAGGDVVSMEADKYSVSFTRPTEFLNRAAKETIALRTCVLWLSDEALPGSFPGITLIRPSSLKSWQTKNEGSWPGKGRPRKLSILFPALVLVAALVVLLFRTLSDKQAALAHEDFLIARMERELGEFQNVTDQSSAVERQFSRIAAGLPVGIYSLFDILSGSFDKGDRMASFRYEGSTRHLSLGLVSRQPIQLLSRIAKSGWIKDVASSGMVPVQGDGSLIRFQLNGTLTQ